MKICIKNGRIIDPTNQRDEVCDLFIEDQFIIGIGHLDGFEADKQIDASGLLVLPGLIDLRARLREPGQEYKATIASESYAAAKAGVTSLCVPPDTSPVIDTPAMARFMQEQAVQTGYSHIYPFAALTRGLKGKELTDMMALTEAGCVGMSNALFPVKDSLVMRRAMQYASTFDLTVFLYANDPWLQGNGCVHEGVVSTRLGLPSIPEAAEIVGVARDLALIETTGVKAHFCSISTARAAEMIAQAQENGLPVTADVAIHNLHLNDSDVEGFDTRYHVIPPLRTEHDQMYLQQMVADGVIQVICSDHQPHENDAKLLPFGESEPGISGVETLLPLTLNLVEQGKLSLNEAVARLTHYPAQILGIDAGQLGVGSNADLCLVDMDKTLDAKQWHSQGKNTPFMKSWALKGVAVQTLIDGQLVDSATDAQNDRAY